MRPTIPRSHDRPPIARLLRERGRSAALAAGTLVVAAAVCAPAASAGVIDVTLAGAGTGAVTSAPAGIDCSNAPGSTQTACSHDFGPSFSTGKLTATPGEGSAFLSWSGAAAGTCSSGAANPCTTALLFFNQSVTATFAPAPDAPTVTMGAVSDVEFPRAKVAGTVNPNSDDFPITDCYFEYGLTADYGEKAACRPKSIGTGSSPLSVSASIGVLDPGRTYHYRLVASNAGDTGRGEDRTFTSAPAPADECPNAAIRAQQGALAQRLPNCGAYELVSPIFTAGQRATTRAGTADGNVAIISSPGGFADVENLPDVGVQYIARRTDSGWETSSIAPPAKDFPFLGSIGALDITRDGSRSLWFANLRADEGTRRWTPIVRDPDGSFHVAGPTQDDVGLSGLAVTPVATSPDLRTVVSYTYSRPPTTDGTTDSRSTAGRSLYASTRGPDGQLSVRQVAYRDGATMFPSCDSTIGGSGGISNLTARNAVSSDGEKIFFSFVCGDAEARRVWVKVGDADPIDLSASQCPDTCGPVRAAAYRGASRDGSRVYFVTEQQLLPEDQDTSSQGDLYEYDFNAVGQKLRLVTGGPDPAGAGVHQSIVRSVSYDGAYAYFVATGRPLAGENNRGVSPQPGAFNLYVYHRDAGQADGSITFVGALGDLDGLNSSPQLSTSGRFLLLQTTANLTGERLAGDTYRDMYRYDAQEDELLRVWTNDPAHNGAARADGAFVPQETDGDTMIPGGGMQWMSDWTPSLHMSDDGSTVGFTTAEPLSPDDRNSATDAYLWQTATGAITMLTDGTSKPGNRLSGSAFVGMTPSGDSLFVVSATPLLERHTSGQNASYVIRRDGGFPEHAPPPKPCAGDACQGSPTESPAPPPVGSVDSSGPGNAPALRPLSVSASAVAAGKAARLRIRVPAAGRLLVAGRSVRNIRKSTAKAGTVTVKVALNRKAERRLEKRKRLRVKVRVVFRPRVGGSVSKTVTVAFEQPKANQKGGR